MIYLCVQRVRIMSFATRETESGVIMLGSSLPPLRSDHCTMRSENTFLAKAEQVVTQDGERVA